jgi:hypothetical protein
MTWNIFKRVAELEVSLARLAGLNHRATEEFHRRIIDLENSVKADTTAEEKRRRLADYKREYYLRNKEKLNAQRGSQKAQDEERKRKAREYSKQYYAKKKLAKLAQTAPQTGEM